MPQSKSYPLTGYTGSDYLLGDNGTAVKRYGLKLPVPRRALIYGDSITWQNTTYSASAWPNNQVTYNGEGYLTWINRLFGHRFYLDPLLNKGVSGESTTQILARYTTDVAANYANFDIAFVLAGSNDLSGATATSTMDTALANIQTIVNNLLAAGKWVVLYGIIPRQNISTDATARKLHGYLNNRLRAWVRTKPGLIFVDTWRSLADPTSSTGAVLANLYAVDGTHPNPAGAYYMAKQTVDAISGIFPPADDYYIGAMDAYDATLNPYGNKLPNPGFMTGTGGAVSTATGTVVGSATLQKLSGNFIASELVGSVEASTAGYRAAPGNKQVITVNIASGKTDTETWQLVQSCTGFVAGDIIQATCEVDLTVAPSRLFSLSLTIGESDNASFPVSASDGYTNLYGGTVTTGVQTGIVSSLSFKTPPYTVQATGRTLYVSLNGGHNAVGGAATATIKLSGMTCHKIG